MTAGYQGLAEIYDRWQRTYGADYSTLIFPRLLDVLQEYAIPPGTFLDVACGTGSLARMMSRRGWTGWGVDASQRMVQEARRKFRKGRSGVTILHQDMRAIHLPERVDLATSMYDSINHVLNLRDLLRVFTGVSDVLRPGGYFVFDTNNERCFRKLWTQTGTIHHRDFALIIQSRYDPLRRLAYSYVTTFLRRGRRYERLGELVRERCFTRAEVRRALRQAGFEVLRQEDFNFSHVPKIGKIKTWWIARKNL